MKKLWLLVVVLAFACSSNTEDPFEPEIIAEAKLFSLEEIGDGQYAIEAKEIGTARFAQDGDVVELRISLLGMTPNTAKAVHIHDGTVEEPGRHWNQGSYQAACNERSMGRVWARPFIGDVGNVPIGSDGTGELILRTDLWEINSGDEKDVLNRPIIVHEMSTDFAEECNPNHSHEGMHSNPKIGGGRIELISDIPLNEQSIATPEDLPDFLICK